MTPAATSPSRLSADDVTTACSRAMTHLQQQTGQELAGRGEPPWDVETTRPGNWHLVGQVWLKHHPATRWHVWAQAGDKLFVQIVQAPKPPAEWTIVPPPPPPTRDETAKGRIDDAMHRARRHVNRERHKRDRVAETIATPAAARQISRPGGWYRIGDFGDFLNRCDWIAWWQPTTDRVQLQREPWPPLRIEETAE